MAAEVYRYLSNGGLLSSYRTKEVISGKMADKDFLKKINPEINPNCRKLLVLSFFLRLGCIYFYKCQTLFFDLL